MTLEEFAKRVELATSFQEQVETMRAYVRGEMAAGRPVEGFDRNFPRNFGIPHSMKDILPAAKQEVVDILSTFSVRSLPQIAHTALANEESRTYIIRILTERSFTEAEEMTLPIYAQGVVPVVYYPVMPNFDPYVPYAIGGKKPTP